MTFPVHHWVSISYSALRLHQAPNTISVPILRLKFLACELLDGCWIANANFHIGSDLSLFKNVVLIACFLLLVFFFFFFFLSFYAVFCRCLGSTVQSIVSLTKSLVNACIKLSVLIFFADKL